MGNGNKLASELAAASSLVANLTNVFSTTLSSLTSVVNNIELRFNELKDLEESVAERITLLDQINEELDKKEEVWTKKEVAMTQKMKVLDEKTREWTEIQARIAKHTFLGSETVLLDVGGQHFTTTKATLLKYEDTFFTDLLYGVIGYKKEFFIDKDPTYFGILLNYMRDGILHDYSSKGKARIRSEFAFYRIPFPSHEESCPFQESGAHQSLFDTGGLLKPWWNTFRAWLPGQHIILLYKGTKDGFSTNSYSTKCHDRGATISVIQSSAGFIFGGYSRSAEGTIHSSSFLFTLSNPHGIPPTKYPLLPGDWTPSAHAKDKYLQLGGKKMFARDIEISSNCHRNKESKCNFPCSFQDSTRKGPLTFTGEEFFTVSEVEVYSVLPSRVAACEFREGQLLSKEYKKIVEQWTNSKFSLLYQATIDGLTSKDITTTCGLTSPILILALSDDGFLFGAYSSIPISTVIRLSDDWFLYGADNPFTTMGAPTDFIFTLTNPHSIPPTRYFTSNEYFTDLDLYQASSFMIGGLDISLRTDNGLGLYTDVHFNFPSYFLDTTGQGNKTFTGTQRARVRELEVYVLSL